jgi:hypothetical protein
MTRIPTDFRAGLDLEIAPKTGGEFIDFVGKVIGNMKKSGESLD